MNPLDFGAGLVAGVALALVVLLPQRRAARAPARAELASADVATALRRRR